MDKCIWDTTNSIARKEKETKLNIPKLTTILSIKNFHHQQRTKKKRKKRKTWLSIISIIHLHYQLQHHLLFILIVFIFINLYYSSTYSLSLSSFIKLQFPFLCYIFFCFWTDFLVGISPIQFLNINTLYHHHIPTGSTFIVTY